MIERCKIVVFVMAQRVPTPMLDMTFVSKGPIIVETTSEVTIDSIHQKVKELATSAALSYLDNNARFGNKQCLLCIEQVAPDSDYCVRHQNGLPITEDYKEPK